MKSSGRFVPWASYGLTVLLFMVYLVERKAMGWGLASYVFDDFAFRWQAFLHQPFQNLPTLFSYTLLHGGWDHLIFNALFFLIFASGVEEVLGRASLVVHFFIWGAVAALIHGFFWPFEGGLIGASGAISGAAGAFFVFYPLRMPRWRLLFKESNPLVHVPSFFWIGLWFLGELKSSFVSLTPEPFSGQVTLVAHGAHIGGFACGTLSTLPTLIKRRRAN